MNGDTADMVVTVTGTIPAAQMGRTLPHEHILVGFAGTTPGAKPPWKKDDVIQRILPFLKDVRAQGWDTFVDCSPSYLGRDPILIEELSRLTGLQILTNTGFYGGQNEKILPPLAFEGTDRDLADVWIKEYREGIEGTDVRPGFIKISVNPSHLTETSRKLVRAAALAHLETGLTIMSHTGPGIPAMEQVEILKQMGVAPDAFIWTHAQAEEDRSIIVRAARDGVWVSLDDVHEEKIADNVELLQHMKTAGCLGRILISHDAGWYDPGKENGGPIRGYTALHDKLLPALREQHFSDAEIDGLIRDNPAAAFQIRIRPFPSP